MKANFCFVEETFFGAAWDHMPYILFLILTLPSKSDMIWYHTIYLNIILIEKNMQFS